MTTRGWLTKSNRMRGRTVRAALPTGQVLLFLAFATRPALATALPNLPSHHIAENAFLCSFASAALISGLLTLAYIRLADIHHSLQIVATTSIALSALIFGILVLKLR